MKRVLYILLSACLLTVSFADAAAQVDLHEVRRGNRHFRRGEYAEAQVEYMKGLAKDSLSIAANYNLANTFFRQGDYANAEKTLARVEEMAVASGDGAAFYYNQGAVAIAQQNWPKAVEAFAKSLMINPDDLDAKENYIYAKKMLQNQQQDQQQNQQQDQQQDQDQEQQQDQEQEQDGGQDGQDDQDGQDSQDGQDDGSSADDNQEQDQQGQDGQSQISPQAAQQMLQAIQAKESETQEKVRKAKAAALRSRMREKNW